MGRRALALAVSVGFVLGFALPAQAHAAPARCAKAKGGGDWARYGRDSANSRWQKRERVIRSGNVGRLRLAWSFKVPQGSGGVASTPLVSHGCLYAATDKGLVFALNADTGRRVWKAKLGNRVSSLALANGRVFANVARWRAPRTVALSARTGRVLWRTRLDGPGLSGCRDYASIACAAEASGSPAVFGKLVMASVSGFSLDQPIAGWYRPGAFRGSILLLDQRTGRVRSRTYVVTDQEWARGLSGAGVWSTPAIDEKAKLAYVGTGNASSSPAPALASSLVKVDVNPAHKATFGRIVGSYVGDPGFDLDFGASPNMIRQKGRLVVGALQKAGSYHLIDASRMTRVWRRPDLSRLNVSGNAGSSATDGRTIFVPTGATPFAVHALDARTGAVRWSRDTPGQGLYGPVSLANGVVYQADLGRLHALDGRTGKELLNRSVAKDVPGAGGTVEGGAAIARHSVFVPAGGVLAAYRLRGRR